MEMETPISPFEEGREILNVYRHLSDRIDIHVKKAHRRSTRYKRMAAVFNILLPLLSLGLTLIVTTQMPHQDLIAVVAATLLTVLASLNAILTPSKKYSQYAVLATQLHDLHFYLEIRLQGYDPKRDQESILSLLEEANEKLSEIGIKMVGMDIPGANPETDQLPGVSAQPR